jgi:hypothetical protein
MRVLLQAQSQNQNLLALLRASPLTLISRWKCLGASMLFEPVLQVDLCALITKEISDWQFRWSQRPVQLV